MRIALQPTVKKEVDKGLRRNLLEVFYHEDPSNVARTQDLTVHLHYDTHTSGVAMVPGPHRTLKGLALSVIHATISLFAARAR